jgi:tRNA 2-thiouridine synthesizing protein A
VSEPDPPAPTEVDAIGLLCPLPVLRADQAARRLGPGRVLVVLADDPAARADLAAWCMGRGHDLLEVAEAPTTGGRPPFRARIRIGPRSSSA